VFSEPVEPALAQLSLIASDGRTTRLAAASDPHDVHAVIAPTTTLSFGAYRLVWRIVSVDGHPVAGSFVFWVGTRSTPAPSASLDRDVPNTWGWAVGGVPVGAAVVRGLGIACLMAATGLLLFIVLTPHPSGVSQSRHLRASTQLALVASGLLTLHLGAWAMNAAADHHLTGESLSVILSTRVGYVELGRTALAVLAFWAVWLARRPGLALLFGTIALAVSGAAGHSAAIHPILTTPAKALHLVAGAAWLGGLLALLIRETDDQEILMDQARRVSSVALASVIIVGLSGVVQTFAFLPHPLDLVRSTYGAVALAKVAGLAVLVGFGAHHRFRMLPKLVDDGVVSAVFVRSLRREVAIMSFVIMLGAWLAYLSPPHTGTSSSTPEHIGQ
jgi:copper transport protein